MTDTPDTVDLDKVNPDTVTVTITRHQPDGSWVSNGVVPNELDGHGGLALAAHSRQRAVCTEGCTARPYAKKSA